MGKGTSPRPVVTASSQRSTYRPLLALEDKLPPDTCRYIWTVSWEIIGLPTTPGGQICHLGAGVGPGRSAGNYVLRIDNCGLRPILLNRSI